MDIGGVEIRSGRSLNQGFRQLQLKIGDVVPSALGRRAGQRSGSGLLQQRCNDLALGAFVAGDLLYKDTIRSGFDLLKDKRWIASAVDQDHYGLESTSCEEGRGVGHEE